MRRDRRWAPGFDAGARGALSWRLPLPRVHARPPHVPVDQNNRTPTLSSLMPDLSTRQDYDDDGEQAAGGRLLHLLQMTDARNVCVVVSRW